MDEKKLLSLLGLCRKAGRLQCGHDSCIEAIRKKNAELCLLSSDSSERLKNEIEKEISYTKKKIPVRPVNSDMVEIGRAVGLKSAVLTVSDEGFAKALLKLTDTEEEVNE